MKNKSTKINKMGKRLAVFAVGIIIALAIAATCIFGVNFIGEKRVAVSGADGGTAITSGNYSNLTGNKVGSLINEDKITYTYAADTIYSITLGMGRYKLEVYGAKGGNGGTGTAGGLGGYSVGEYRITASSQTLYIVVGGSGIYATSNSNNAGGYNGGGNSGFGTYSSASYGSGSGGGATHIATASGLLKNVSSGNVLIVAGGGGGAQSRAGGNGGGGNDKGQACPASSYGSGGCGASTSGPHDPQHAGHSGSDSMTGTYGQGGAAMMGGDTYYGGGGGGGYYGGCGAKSDGSQYDDYGGGGGSAYLSSSLVAGTTGGSQGGNDETNGKAIITAVEVNRPPTATAGVSITLNARGTASSVVVNANSLASDPDTAQTDAERAIYFTKGDSNDYDVRPTTLYVDSAMSIDASKYFTWEWIDNAQIKFTGVNLYPRKDVDNSTANGKITVYTRVRDNFGTNKARGICNVSFVVNVLTNSVSLNTGTFGTNIIGSSVSMAAPEVPENSTGIYNPNGANRNTLFIKKSLVINQPYDAITAESLVKNVPSHQMVVISINNPNAIANYKIRETANTVTAYDKSGSLIPNAYTQLTIECLTPVQPYQVLPITLYIVEKSTAHGATKPNVSPDIDAISLELVFKMENTRPVLKSGVSNIVELKVGETKALALDTYFSDADNATISSSTHSILSVVVPKKEFILINKQKNVIVPTSPNATYYNKGNALADGSSFSATAQSDTPTGNTSAGFSDGIAYNATSPVSGTSREQAFMMFTYSGDTVTATGLRASFSQYTSARSATAPGHFYLLLHIRDNRDSTDDGIWLPIAFTVGNTLSHTPVDTLTDPTSAITGQNKSTLYPVASGSVGQSFYFAPMGINYNGSNVVGKYKSEDASGDNTGALTNAGLQPLALDGDNFTTTSGAALVTGRLNEFLKLSDISLNGLVNFVKTVSEKRLNSGSSPMFAENIYFKAEFFDLYIKADYIASNTFENGRVVASSGTADANGFKYLGLEGPVTEDGVNYYVTKGLKIKLKSATMNRYFYGTIGVVDSAGNSCNTVDIAIRVNNTAPNALTSNVATFGDKTRGDSAYSEYEYNSASGVIPTLTYRVALGSTFAITPYDLASDFDMRTRGDVPTVTGGFTINGQNGKFNPSTGVLTLGNTSGAGDTFTGVFGTAYREASYLDAVKNMLGIVNGFDTVKKISDAANGTAKTDAVAANGQVKSDRLFFERISSSSDAFGYAPTNADFAVMEANTYGFITITKGCKVSIGGGEYPLDFLIIKADNRTSQPAVINLKVRDCYGDSPDGIGTFSIKLVVEVVNTRPTIKDTSFCKSIAVTAIGADGSVTPTTAMFAANGNAEQNGLMEDHDRDTPQFMTARGVLIANTRALVEDLKYLGLESFSDSRIPAEYLVDAAGISLTSYMSATVVSREVLSVTALSSTKHIASGVFVYFFVNDGNGGISLGYVQVEVVNTSPLLNSAEDGFDITDPLWSIEALDSADINRDRYIVGSQSAKTLLKQKISAYDIDIKLIATDADALHGSVILSQRYKTGDVYNYSNLAMPAAGEALNAAALQAAIPSIFVGTDGQRFTDFSDTPASVVLFTKNVSSNTESYGLPTTNLQPELLFYIGDNTSGSWVSRAELVTRLTGKAFDSDEVRTYFDEKGRWKVDTWALRLASTAGYERDKRLGVRFSLRDEASKGGDTAGVDTAYKCNRNEKNADGALDNREVVTGSLITTVYQHISQTGIRSLDDYLGKNDNYYVVDYTDTTGSQGVKTTYIPTYDGDTDSTYTVAKSTLGYKDINGKNKLSTDSGYTSIKTRAAGTADNTLAGINSGDIYDASKGAVQGAFKYTDTINIPSVVVSPTATGDNEHPEYAPVYVPMSYFGFLKDLTTATTTEGNIGSVAYPDEYVGYDVNTSEGIIALGNISDFAAALSISDGVTSWSGSSLNANPLNANPYVNVEAFYCDGSSQASSSKKYFTTETYASYSSPYYNNRLTVTTVNGAGELQGYEKYSDNHKSFVGDGKLMYLEEQAEKLKEHNFGLRFSKKNVRTAVRDLTFTIKLAKSRAGKNVATEDTDKRIVTLKIHVDNSKFDLYNNAENTSTVKYDTVKNTYYMDVQMRSSESKSFALARRLNANGNIENVDDVFNTGTKYQDAVKIAYIDNDYTANNSAGYRDSYRDYAYFYSDSFNRMSDWYGDDVYKRAIAVADNKFINTADSDKAQGSIANYFGVASASAASGISDAVLRNYKPNIGIYGSGETGKEGYSGYFNASLLESGRVLNIMSVRKTYINDFALKDLVGDNPTYQQIIDAYAARGLIAEYDSTVTKTDTAKYESGAIIQPSKVYYPFKMLIYDSCGAEWASASYVAIELRIQILNGAPTLKNVGETVVTDNGAERRLTLNLAVGNTVSINLYDIVYDPDIYTPGSNGIYVLSTKSALIKAEGIARETGDYLASPIEKDEYKSITFNPNNVVTENGHKYIPGGGFSSRDTNRDVIMWMETTSGDSNTPTSNSISFTVKRRTTTTSDGAVNEYRFKLKFFDGENEATGYFVFIINVTNQAPSITAIDRSFTMRAGDDLTVLTMYYDRFTAADAANPEGSAAYKNSKSYRYMTARKGTGFGTSNGDGQNNSTYGNINNKYWNYENITTAAYGNNVVHNSTISTRNGTSNVHLGYYALANDDTPWRLRITDVKLSSIGKLQVQGSNYDQLALYEEDSDPLTSRNKLSIAVRIIAMSACVNEPITFTISDGEGGTATCTLYFTIISSPPVALEYSKANERVSIEAGKMEGVAENGEYLSATYRLFTVPAASGGTFNVDGFPNVQKTANREHIIRMTNVARDPDGQNETNNMMLFRDGCFAVNDVPLVRGSDGKYRYAYFDIEITDGGRAFKLTSTGYNPDIQNGYEKLTFRIADYGNGADTNTLTITLRVYTLYSDIINPTVAAKNNADYISYLNGGDTVKIKSHDAFYGNNASVDPSVYAFVSLTGNNGNDGNTQSPIVDPDATKAGDASYAVKLYALFDYDDTTGDIKAFDTERLQSIFTRNSTKRTFALNRGGDYDFGNYLIGGLDSTGNELAIAAGARARLETVLHYTSFEFSSDGTFVKFIPNSSTLDNKNLLLYVEAEKPMGNRGYKRTDAQLYAGSVFRLDVQNSAPTAVGGAHAATGMKGDKISFKIFDKNDHYGALFVDSDVDDFVTMSAFSAADYDTAMRTAMTENPRLDWNAGENKPRAFTIDIEEDNSISFTINRRIDYVVDNVYQPSVTFKVVLTGKDRMNATATTIVELTIVNTPISAVETMSNVNRDTGVGYEFKRNNDISILNVKVRCGSPLDINLLDFIVDNDYAGAVADTDSFRFVKYDAAYPMSYLGDNEAKVSWFELSPNGNINPDKSKEIASVTPIGADSTHRTGIRVTALDSVRNLTGTIYVRILDRAASATQQNAGIIIKINLVVMNDSPFALEGKETSTVYMLGSDSKEPRGMLFFIGDFVGDNNSTDVVGDTDSAYTDTYLRIFRQESRNVDNIYSSIHSDIKGLSDGLTIHSSALFSVSIPNRIDSDLLQAYCDRNGYEYDYKDNTNSFNQWFVVTPEQGFYGSGSIDITVADGDTNTYTDTLMTTFRINVHVVYDPAETSNALKPVTLACSKTMTLDMNALMPEIENKLAASMQAGGNTANAMFNQSGYYRLVGIDFQSDADRNKATITQVGNTSTWTLVAGSQITIEPVRVNVRFVLDSDPSRVYEKNFRLSIVPNQAPKMLYSDITFVRYNETGTPDALRDLDASGTIKLEAWQLFNDPDDPTGNALRLISAESKVGSLVNVTIEKDVNNVNRFIVINFIGRGESEITVMVTDETGVPVALTFTARNNDLPQASMWVRVMASWEANRMMWVLIVIGALFVIIMIMVIIVVHIKRKQAREELEALLVSEMEIEEQMLKLAGGSAYGGAQSFGYLPPVAQSMPADPSLMLGAGMGDGSQAAGEIPPTPDGM